MTTEFTELIPGLPEELALECLTRLHFSAHKSASFVCQRWRNLLNSKSFYYHRKKTKFTQISACLVQSTPTLPGKSTRPDKYTISLFDPVTNSWERIDPVPKYRDGLPLFCHLASSEGKLVLLGGWDPDTYEPIRDVFIYDFVTCRWKESCPMPSKRSFFATAAVSGTVYVAGGHDENKNALKTGLVFDIMEDKWTELGQMVEERDECHGFVSDSGNYFWVVSGYGTDNQGAFKTSAEVYEFGLKRWSKVDDVWAENTCPRGNVGEGQNGKLSSWSGSEEGVRVGTCGVDLGDRVLVSGSGYQGGPHGFYLGVNKGKLVKMDVPDDFSGFVQTGCCVEI